MAKVHVMLGRLSDFEHNQLPDARLGRYRIMGREMNRVLYMTWPFYERHQYRTTVNNCLYSSVSTDNTANKLIGITFSTICFPLVLAGGVTGVESRFSSSGRAFFTCMNAECCAAFCRAFPILDEEWVLVSVQSKCCED